MLYLKEDDMDEMMRKAAENYEVDAEHAADWQAVYKAVHESEDGPLSEEKKKKRRFAFWWLLLIPLGWIANTEYNKFEDAHKKPTTVSVVTESKANGNAQKSNDQKAASSGTTDQKTNEVTNNTTAEKNGAASTKQTVQSKQTALFSLKHFNAHSNPYTVKQATSNTNFSDNNTAPQLQQQNNSEPQASSQPTVVTNLPSVSNNNSINNSSGQTTANATNNTSSSLIKDTAQPNNNNVVVKKSSAEKTKINPHYFYAGVMAGADLSFIKYQQAEPLGYNVGLLVGYKFSKRLSIESGVYLAMKNYYTSGEYFDKSNIPYFWDKEIIDANGYCKMFEIPLNIKYDISTKKNHTWYASTGLSSYLMNKEYYHFNYTKNGVEYSGSAPYYHTTQDWFSVLNLSAGYELKTGNKTDLRIEPYFKTTLNGVGTGNLSISSVGVNAGIVRQIP